MKCKLSKLFFLALIGAVSVNGYSQTEEGRKKIVKDYDLVALNKLAKEFDEQFKANYSKALEIIKAKGMPINGVDSKGAYFSLKGIDEATGEILYYKTSNNTPTNSSVQTVRAQHLYSGGSLGLDIQGQLMTLGIWDGGQPQASHQNLGIPRITNKDGANTISGSPQRVQEGIDHATHVAGTMIGNGIAVPNARGIAFQAYLWANNWENDIAEMTLQATQGLLVSNHSYGVGNDDYVNTPGIFGRYTQGARDIDVVTSEAPNYLPVFAAGNDRRGIWNGNGYSVLNSTRGGYDLLTHDNVAKNGVVVAAIEGFTNYTSAANVIMSDFSQWGPTDDFRIKPDISAKGVAVYSSNMPLASSVNSYASYPGTSMAAPAVTAVFALWQQYFKDLNLFIGGLENMRAASLKALMAHTASPAGKYIFQEETLVSPVGPNPVFGWGVINASGGAEILGKAYSENPTAVFKELELDNGDEYVLNVTLDGTQKLNATIAWTDLPSSVVSGTDSDVPLLINDLDLRIYRPDDVAMVDPAMPYKLNKSWVNLYTTTGDNDVDPIEKVTYFGEFDGLAEAGVYKVVVRHKGNLTGGSQNFTLVVDGGVVSFDEDVSVDEVQFENLKIYPNPVTDVVNISSDMTTIEGAKITIYDMIGKKVYESDSLFEGASDALIDVSNFNTGVYLIEILKDNKKDTRKIIIK